MSEFYEEFLARPYHFSGNYDCSACGRHNMPHAIQIFSVTELAPRGKYFGEHCSSCIYEIAIPEELAAWEDALGRIREGRELAGKWETEDGTV